MPAIICPQELVPDLYLGSILLGYGAGELRR
jgi:hypothetical protein